MLAQVDSTRLLWMKNVNHPQRTRWAYYRGHEENPPVPSPPGQVDFRMHWPTGSRATASRPARGDLMLLCQRGRATHLVRFLDGGPVEDPAFPDHTWRRSVEAVWFADPVDTAPRQELALGFDPRFANGDSRRLESCEGYRSSQWLESGGLPALQDHIISLLAGWHCRR